MKKRLLVLSLALVLGFSSVGFADVNKKKAKMKNVTLVSAPQNSNDKIAYDFKDGLQGFKGNFADLPADDNVEEFYELKFGHGTIPIDGQEITGIFLSGNNHSDDLFMYTYVNLGESLGLEKNTLYDVMVNLKIATNAPADAAGVGGAPGESVYVKVGVVDTEPKTVLDSNNYYRLNLDKANQEASGKDMQVVGNLAKTNGTTDNSYENKSYSYKTQVKTDNDGNAYLVIGTDSGFEGPTSIYINDIVVDVAKAE